MKKTDIISNNKFIIIVEIMKRHNIGEKEEKHNCENRNTKQKKK